MPEPLQDIPAPQVMTPEVPGQELLDAELESLQQTAPELFEGRLPADLQDRFTRAFGEDADYAIGINQSVSEGTPEEVAETVARQGGIPKQYGSFASQHQIYDASEADAHARYALTGYYGPEIGRHVVIFPSKKTPEVSPGAIARDTKLDALPADFVVKGVDEKGQPETKINPKYIAGYIDEGQFFTNASFLTDEAPRYEAKLPGDETEIKEIGEIALRDLVIRPQEALEPYEPKEGPFITAQEGDDDSWM